MQRIMAIDYGLKRCGIAISDPLQLIANPLQVVAPAQLIPFIENYIRSERVESILFGLSKDLQNNDNQLQKSINQVIKIIQNKYPLIQIHLLDERFTSRIAEQTLSQMNLKRKVKHDKKNIDQIAAIVLLQDFLSSRTSK